MTVIDRQAGAARETSLANGGQISSSHSEPWAHPGAVRRILHWLGREDAPLLYRPRLDPEQWRWAAAFLLECLPARTEANVRAIVGLALHSRAEVKSLRRELQLDYQCVERGILHFYTDRSEFEASLAPAALMRSLGCERRPVSPEEAVELEPALAVIRSEIVGADYCADDESGDALPRSPGPGRRAPGGTPAAGALRLSRGHGGCLHFIVLRRWQIYSLMGIRYVPDCVMCRHNSP